MSNIRRAAIGLTFGAALMGSFAGLALAAEADGGACYYHPEAKASSTAAPASKSGVRIIAERGSWQVFSSGAAVIVGNVLADGTSFTVGFKGDHKLLILDNAAWHLEKGKVFALKIAIDGQMFLGEAVALDDTSIGTNRFSPDLTAALYRGHQATISFGAYTGDMDLRNVKPVIDDTLRQSKASEI